LGLHAGITIDIDPTLLAAGLLTIRWYGLMISLAILVGVLLGIREATRRGISEDDVLYMVLWGVPAALIGARLFHVIDAWDYYSTYPLQIIAFQEGGLAIYGGLAGGLLAGALAARHRGLLSWKLLDIAAPSMILGQAIGRVGCFINGDHQGPPTNLPWATSYVHPGNLAPDSLPRHPAQVYELIYDLLLFGLLLLLRRRLRRDGLLFATYVAVYAFGRFWISALREDAPFLMGLKEAQVISVAAFVVAVPLMAYLWRRPRQVASPES
jgi:phosphatidylglycerol---prolipoprotein diacylglyceryl transferase